MFVIKCSKEGCIAQFGTETPLAKGATYSCSQHTKSLQRERIVFQDYSFDSGLDGALKESEEYDNDWGAKGRPLLPSDKCEHGVFSPDGDTRYCTICNPAKITGVGSVKKHRGLKIKIGTFSEPNEQLNQTLALVLFYQSQRVKQSWVTDKDSKFSNLNDYMDDITQQWKPVEDKSDVKEPRKATRRS